MKSVLLSIQPQWVDLIATGRKLIEIRKTKPKLNTPFKVYIYCTQDKYVSFANRNNCSGNGKIVGEFVCDNIYTFEYEAGGFLVNGDIATTQNAQAMTCLSDCEFRKYAKEKSVYGLHISNLAIYDEPKMLHHFFKPCGDCDKKGTKRCTEELTDCRAKVITRPPQSWCYVEELKNDKEVDPI